jgi:hypothetical protein
MKLYIPIIASIILTGCSSPKIKDYTEAKTAIKIFPDYINIAIPPNIAPLNFHIDESGSAFFVKIYSENGKGIDIFSNEPEIQINKDKWYKLLNQNKGKDLTIEVFVKNNNKWTKFNTIKNYITDIEIENYLAYRLINVGYVLWKKIGIYQRNLTNFDETPIFENSSADETCVNCHSFCKNQPDKMSIHFRAMHGGTIIIDGNIKKKINTQTKYTMSAAVYPSWNPNGKQIAYSVNKINQYFTSDTSIRTIVSDNASDIIVYDLETNTITTSPKISTRNRENTPSWSPDGKWLYFVSAPECHDQDSRNYTKYSLLRIAFNADSLSWGNVDTVISSDKTGLSFSFPRISPNGKYVLVTGADFGYFSILNAKSDLYLFDLESKELIKPEALNSYESDSYHDWSETGKWFVFASKRIDGLFSRPFFCYIDETGKVYKPFVLPQKDPLFYKSFTQNYNVPELITGKVELSARNMRDLVLQQPDTVLFDKNVDLDALSGATRIFADQKQPAH